MLASVVMLAPQAEAATPKCFEAGATKVGTARDDTIRGTDEADVIVAKGGNDTILGLGGDDVICAGKGNDKIGGGAGADTISGEAGHDRVSGDADDDFVGGSGGRDVVNGNAGGDFVFGGAGNDKLNGHAGDDSLYPQTGDDELRGGLGTNWADYSFSETPVQVNLATGTATGEGRDRLFGVPNIVGSAFDDIIRGNSDTNLVLARAGNDTVVGGPTSTSGEEDQTDIVDAGDGDDSVDGGDGFDMISFQSMQPATPESTTGVDVNLTNGTATGQGTDDFQSIEAAWGSKLNDQIRGDSNGNFLVGSEGDDDIRGVGGFDYAIFWFASGAVQANLATGVATGEGNDTLANDVEGLFGSILGNDTLTGDNKDNFLGGDLGNDTLDGAGGDDWLQGGGGNDSIEGGAGDYDLADYSTSFAAVTANLASGTASGDGNDTLANLEALYGSVFADSLTGNDSRNFIFGDFGADQISAGLGNDEIDGGPDADTGDGGAGTNECANVEQATQCTSVAATSIDAHPLLTAAQAVAEFRRNF